MTTKPGARVGASSMAASLILLTALVSAWIAPAALADSSTMEKMKDITYLAAEEAKVRASRAAQDAKETTGIWADWARDKIAEGLGLRHANAKVAADRMMETANDMAAMSKEKIHSAAAGAAEMVGQAKDGLNNKATSDMPTAGANDAANSAESAYDAAKERMLDAYKTAKDTMTEGAGANYEAAKEKVSQAAGDVGAKMQEMSAEL